MYPLQRADSEGLSEWAGLGSFCHPTGYQGSRRWSVGPSHHQPTHDGVELCISKAGAQLKQGISCALAFSLCQGSTTEIHMELHPALQGDGAAFSCTSSQSAPSPHSQACGWGMLSWPLHTRHVKAGKRCSFACTPHLILFPHVFHT